MPILCLIMFIRVLTCFPMSALAFRAQFFSTILGKRFPGYALTILFNIVLLASGFLFAMFFDKIGDIFRFGLSFCAMIYIYIIPCLIEMLAQKRELGYIPIWSYILHIVLASIGTLVFVAQFFVTAY